MSVTFKAVGRSDVGRLRTNNEDSAAITTIEREEGNYAAWLVADGMGGLAHGEVASSLALETAVNHLHEAQAWDDPGAVLRAAFIAANAAVFERGTGEGELTQSGMGTTLVAILAEERTGRFWVGNVGDSRAYLLSPDGLRQVTDDHSLVADRVRLGELTGEEARSARHRNVITRAIGVDRVVEPDVFGPAQFHASDRVLLCSDGLHGMLADDEIAAIAEGTPTDQLPDRLIDAANAAGGRDNITVVVAAPEGAPPTEQAATVRPRPEPLEASPLFVAEPAARSKRMVVAIASVAAIVVVAGGIWAGATLFGGNASTAKPTATPVPNQQSQSDASPVPPATPGEAPTQAPSPTPTPATGTSPAQPSGAGTGELPGCGQVFQCPAPRHRHEQGGSGAPGAAVRRPVRPTPFSA